jgi:hypothetical protein
VGLSAAGRGGVVLVCRVSRRVGVEGEVSLSARAGGRAPLLVDVGRHLGFGQGD